MLTVNVFIQIEQFMATVTTTFTHLMGKNSLITYDYNYSQLHYTAEHADQIR